VNVDYSPAVIAMMSARMSAELYPSVSWRCLDFRSMASGLPAASFDVVLDKGSLDAVWSDGGSQWTPSTEVLADISATIEQIVLLLRPGGRFVSISFGQPHFRLPFMLQGHEEQWRLLEQPVRLGLYYIYVFVKGKCKGFEREGMWM
jgi:SAM-dependent methyltransferase